MSFSGRGAAVVPSIGGRCPKPSEGLGAALLDLKSVGQGNHCPGNDARGEVPEAPGYGARDPRLSRCWRSNGTKYSCASPASPIANQISTFA
jgi:hypothetical protein